MTYETRLNCERCGQFTEFQNESKAVVRCGDCAKRHSVDSLHMVEPDKTYHRDETGELHEETP